MDWRETLKITSSKEGFDRIWGEREDGVKDRSGISGSYNRVGWNQQSTAYRPKLSLRLSLSLSFHWNTATRGHVHTSRGCS